MDSGRAHIFRRWLAGEEVHIFLTDHGGTTPSRLGAAGSGSTNPTPTGQAKNTTITPPRNPVNGAASPCNSVAVPRTSSQVPWDPEDRPVPPHVQGPAGKNGPQGNTGPQGSVGPVGPRGVKGFLDRVGVDPWDLEEKGSCGTQGSDWTSGRGPVGPGGRRELRVPRDPLVQWEGPVGPRGIKGVTGPRDRLVHPVEDPLDPEDCGEFLDQRDRLVRSGRGPVGPRGFRGLPGPAGPIGPSGRGPVGPRGMRGLPRTCGTLDHLGEDQWDLGASVGFPDLRDLWVPSGKRGPVRTHWKYRSRGTQRVKLDL